MTDNEIIKCLRHCRAGDCENCKALKVCDATFSFHKEALDLIIRQKDEIERLEKELELANADKVIAETHEKSAKEMFVDVTQQIKTAKSEAIKEFAERLTSNLKKDLRLYGNCTYYDCVKHIDNLVKEMTEVSE